MNQKWDKIHISSQLAIVMVNYKTPRLVIDSLVTLLPEVADIDCKIVIVDNYSNDNSCQILDSWINEHDSLNQIILVASHYNSGFSGGNNTGISKIHAEYYLLLNSDTLIKQGAIKQLLKSALYNPTVGLISPRLEWPDASPQESCFRYHTPISELISSAKTGFITKLLHRYDVPLSVSDEVTFCDWTSFACVLIKKNVFDDIGLMDDGYFMYFEDVAFSCKASRAGWTVMNVPDAHVVHLRGGSSPVKAQAKLRKRLPRYFYESRARYFYQSFGRFGLLAANLLWTLGWGISSFRQLVSPKFVPDISKSQWRDIWINFSNPLKPFVHPDNYDKT